MQKLPFFMTHLSLIIATYNRAPYLMRTLRSVAMQTLENSLYEVIVVNNNSTDNTAEQVEQFRREHPQIPLRLIRETQQGLSHARNCGIENSSGEFIVFIDDDEEINPIFLAEHYNLYRQHPQVAAAGGVMTPLYEFPTPKWLSPYTEKLLASALNLGPRCKPFRRGSYPIGGNMSMRRRVFADYGLFNTQLGRTGSTLLGGEEKDLFERLRAGGEQIYYLPTAIVLHIIPQERLTDAFFKKLTRQIGISERLRTQGRSPKAYGMRLMQECVKWAGAGVLALGYLLRGTPAKGQYLLKMRYNITRGLLDV